MSEQNIPYIMGELINIDCSLQGHQGTAYFFKHALRWLPDDKMRQEFRELPANQKTYYLAKYINIEPLVMLYDAIALFYKSITEADSRTAKVCWNRINLMTQYFSNATRYSVLIFIDSVETSLTNYPTLGILANLDSRPDIFTRPFLQQLCQLNEAEEERICEIFFPTREHRTHLPQFKKRRTDGMMSYIK